MIRLLLLFAMAVAALAGAPAQAQLSFSLRTGEEATNAQSMPIDSNKCATDGPRATYVGGVITNNGATTATGIVATMSPLGNGFFLAGGQAADQSIGALGPGQSTGVYWFVGYGCVNGATVAPTLSFASSAGTTNVGVSLTARAAIKASAGGTVTSSLLGPGAVVGQTIWFDASYSFGGSDVGDEFMLQPAGGQNFNAGCFRLVGTEVRTSTITPIAPGTRDRIYFRQTVKQTGTGYTATIRYHFEYLCAGTSTTARPYALQTSGSSNIKYTGNFDGAGSISIAFPGATNPFTIAKSSNVATAVAGAATTVTYTVTVANPSAHDSRISAFVDTLPPGASFVGLHASSQVTAANSSSVPAAGATGTIAFVGRQDQSYLIAAGGSVSLVYQVLMPATAGTYVNSARAEFGAATTPTATASFTVTDPQPLVLVKSSVAAADPLNGTVNPKQIPGGRTAYTISVTNPNPVAATGVALVDATPPQLELVVSGAGGPVLFQDGSPASGLSYAFGGLGSMTDQVDFSNDGGATWTYVPVANARGTDPAVTHVRIRPQGAMAAGASFSLGLSYLIK